MNLIREIWQTMSSIFKGMGITFRHLGKKPVTQQFPGERWALPNRFRGFVHNDIPRCTACLLCAKACPVDCIYIELEGKGKERKTPAEEKEEKAEQEQREKRQWQ